MDLLKLIKNRITTEWKGTFNTNVDILNRNARDQDQKLETTNSRIDNLVLHSGGESPNEVVDARVNNKTVQFHTLAARLLDTENTHDKDVEQLNLIIVDLQEQLKQLTNAVGTILGTYNTSWSMYVSKSRGNDQTGDGTQDNPFQTIQMAVNLIPLISASAVTIFIEAGTYLEDIYFRSINSTIITIRPVDDYTIFTPATQDLPVKVRSIQFSYCSGVFYVFGLQFVDTLNAAMYGNIRYSIAHAQGGYMDVRKCKFADNNKSVNFRTIYSEGNAKTTIGSNSYFTNQYSTINAGFLSDIFIGVIEGTGNATGFNATAGTIRGGIPSGFATTMTNASPMGSIYMREQVIS